MRLIIEARLEGGKTSATEATIVAVLERKDRSVADLDSALPKGRALLAEVQSLLVSKQAARWMESQLACHRCGSMLAHKDARSIALRRLQECCHRFESMQELGRKLSLGIHGYGMIALSVLCVDRFSPADVSGTHASQRVAAILSAEMRRGENSSFDTATLTCPMQCAPSSVHRIWRFLTLR